MCKEHPDRKNCLRCTVLYMCGVAIANGHTNFRRLFYLSPAQYISIVQVPFQLKNKNKKYENITVCCLQNTILPIIP
jgi:hypothetical protein